MNEGGENTNSMSKEIESDIVAIVTCIGKVKFYIALLKSLLWASWCCYELKSYIANLSAIEYFEIKKTVLPFVTSFLVHLPFFSVFEHKIFRYGLDLLMCSEYILHCHICANEHQNPNTQNIVTIYNLIYICVDVSESEREVFQFSFFFSMSLFVHDVAMCTYILRDVKTWVNKWGKNNKNIKATDRLFNLHGLILYWI